MSDIIHWFLHVILDEFSDSVIFEPVALPMGRSVDDYPATALYMSKYPWVKY